MPINLANLLSINYRSAASTFRPSSLIDIHTHINQALAGKVYKEVANLYGIKKVFSMTPLAEVSSVREVLGDMFEPIAIPNFYSDNLVHELGSGFLTKLDRFHELGAKIVKFWSAPRGHDMSRAVSSANLFALGTPARIEAMQKAQELKMIFMVHVGDPNTWFATKYKDASIYGSKIDQYHTFRELLSKFSVPWIAAHMGGWPEDLEFLSNLLVTHNNLYLDTSATKWMVRELSKHSTKDLLEFLDRWQNRILFGSDIVAKGLDLKDAHTPVFDLYASRYWALRTMFETDYSGQSPIVDPDLHMVDPLNYDQDSAPKLVGRNLPDSILDKIYFNNANKLLGLGL